MDNGALQVEKMWKYIVAILLLSTGLASASPVDRGMRAGGTQAVFIDEGRDPIPFSVTCSSQLWTTLVSSSSIGRSINVFTPSDNTVDVCISTFSTTAITCLAETNGIQLTKNEHFTIYAPIKWFCRAKATATAVIKGYYSRDRNDFGYNQLNP
jgi:hypothetical protein